MFMFMLMLMSIIFRNPYAYNRVVMTSRSKVSECNRCVVFLVHSRFAVSRYTLGEEDSRVILQGRSEMVREMI